MMGSSDYSSAAATDSKLEIDANTTTTTTRSTMLHFCFLVHGFMGNPKEMSYIESALTKASTRRTLIDDGKGSNQKFFFHSATCNTDNTYDGIANGGTRLADEIKSYIKSSTRSHFMEDRKDQYLSEMGEQSNGAIVQNVTISFVGNSLGGLYSRYAIAKLAEHSKRIDNGFILYEKNPCQPDQMIVIRVFFNVFATTACPHLGVHRHTYMLVPQFLETVMAHVLSDTGRDLFRLTGLVREMTLSPQYLDVLRSFRRRIAYANAHNTDFQVPTNTAAFLCKHSRYPHTFVEEENKDDTTTTTSWMAGTFYTKKVESDLYEIIHKYSSLENPMDKEGTDQLELSLALDSLGWKKVFVDVRDLLPLSIPIPFVKEPKLVNHYQKEKSEGGLGTMESRQIIPFVSSSNRISFPNGHTTMVANSKSDFVAWLNSNGRIIMNQFAAELVNDMLSWSPE
eukprot:CAMPEP_0172429856 /NCGR_PEP_ID=MMETSP1064-20121228/52182_1 /TAXON_ID=202472 /ORGANISM="Aulacoseira subarctica , Strain CCAP 1002/5" /LENGTH=452 /DNA_ID=CAMNT_0013175547 /DNA_START=246 /DNA_END=1604 /DNA_ORIENTATION=-